MMSCSGSVDRRRARRTQGGETLIETLITVFLIATWLIAVIATTSALLVSVWVHRKTIEAGNNATSIAEAIDQVDYQACGASFSIDNYKNKAPVQAALTSMGSGWQTPAITVEFLQPSGQGSFGACPGVDAGVQRIKVKVVASGARSARAEIVLIKRNDRCPPGAPTMVGQPC